MQDGQRWCVVLRSRRADREMGEEIGVWRTRISKVRELGKLGKID